MFVESGVLLFEQGSKQSYDDILSAFNMYIRIQKLPSQDNVDINLENALKKKGCVISTEEVIRRGSRRYVIMVLNVALAASCELRGHDDEVPM